MCLQRKFTLDYESVGIVPESSKNLSKMKDEEHEKIGFLEL